MYPFNQQKAEQDTLLSDLVESCPRLRFSSQFTSDKHQNHNSLLFRYEAEENFGSYLDGKPTTFSKWFVIVNLSKSNPTGLATGDNLKDELRFVKFHSEFFMRLPNDLDRTRCHVSISAVKISGQWCSSCNGQFDCIALSHIVHQYIKSSSLPKESIVYIGKTITPIDWNNVDDLRRVKAMARANHHTIVNGLQQIDAIDRKLNNLQTEKMAVTKSISLLGHGSDYFEQLIDMIKK